MQATADPIKATTSFSLVKLLLGVGVIVASLLAADWVSSGISYLHSRYRARATIPERLEQYGPEARTRWKPYFDRAGVTYPPTKVVLVGLKQEKQLEVYATSDAAAPRLIRAFPILAASGSLGPKLRQGDMQVPEGLYRIESLNPNSAYHLSLRVNYPNAADREQARIDGRKNLGGDIMIHGNRVSIGCLAMGDSAAEDLFTLAADTKLSKIEVILAPVDFRVSTLPAHYDATLPAWIKSLYQEIGLQLSRLSNTR